ncbi:YbhQ family protein [Klebsiella pneumoniae subsp. pneumoniae]|nr:YbhQ family protein [Klebsiella pneumoniae subsp. pneumoniae]
MIALWLLSRVLHNNLLLAPRRAGDTGRPGGGLAAGER